jgi:hypothetical protein
MSYDLMRDRLLRHFKNEHDIWDEFLKRKKELELNGQRSSIPSISNTNTVTVNRDIGITISYPGYKTDFKYGKYVYDYRVSFKGIAISHPSIIIDLFNKAVQLGDNYKLLEKFLIDLAKKGDAIELQNHQFICDFNFSSPDPHLLEKANVVYRRQNKLYLIDSNRDFNFSIKELVELMSWITLQEDINYPMEKGFQGRRMPYYRYIEAVYCGKHNERNLSEVVERALAHNRPTLWSEIDYSAITRLGN